MGRIVVVCAGSFLVALLNKLWWEDGGRFRSCLGAVTAITAGYFTKLSERMAPYDEC